MLAEILSGILGLVFLVGAFRQYQRQGAVWSAEYFAASPKERKKMRTRQNYYFSATACLVIGLSLVWVMLYSLTDLKLFLYLIFFFSALLFLLLVYGAVRAVRLNVPGRGEKNDKKRRRG